MKETYTGSRIFLKNNYWEDLSLRRKPERPNHCPRDAVLGSAGGCARVPGPEALVPGGWSVPASAAWGRAGPPRPPAQGPREDEETGARRRRGLQHLDWAAGRARSASPAAGEGFPGTRRPLSSRK